MDRQVFQDTFSKLHASEERIQEVLSMSETMNAHPRGRRIRRSALTAAAVAASLCVCAGAANAATGGELAERITYRIGEMLQINDYKMMAQTDEGGQVIVYNTDVEVVKDGERVLLNIGEEEIDITKELKENNAYTYERTDGDTTIHVEVEPDPEHSGHWRYGVSFRDAALPDDSSIAMMSYGSTASDTSHNGVTDENS